LNQKLFVAAILEITGFLRSDFFKARLSKIIFSKYRHHIMLDKKLLSILVCPVSKGPLEYDEAKQELICKASGLAYPVRDDIPVMLESEARKLTDSDLEA